ncbi:MAG: lipoyl synthase [Lentisphaerae bacterium]|nr:lipoyl synthase [Lentisphaerota bacterium]
MVERKPDWLKVKLGGGAEFVRLRELIHANGLHTVCEEALCPNMGECWGHGRATLMILGNICTRGCLFCNVTSGRPCAPDASEPNMVAKAIKSMGLKDVVITSVTRDDLDDGGASIWAATIECIHETVPGVRVEVLIPDFRGRDDSFRLVLNAAPEIVGHNLETVRSLCRKVRPDADYDRSLNLLKWFHNNGAITKSGIMVGLGETFEEVQELMSEVAGTGCDIFYVGQYLRPSKKHIAVSRYVEPGEFDSYLRYGYKVGFKVVVSAPLVRSSYHSDIQADFIAKQLENRAALSARRNDEKN